MSLTRPLQRWLGFGVLLAMATFVALGYLSIRRDVQNLRTISQDNILWTAMQMEVELLRFQVAVAALEIEGGDAALAEVRERFDLLWSRIFMLGSGRVGELIARYDTGQDAISGFQQYLRELDPAIATLAPGDSAQVRAILRELDTFRHDLRLYTLRVVRGDTAAAALVRDRIQRSSLTTMAIGLGALLLSLLALALILHDNRRQREIAALHRRLALDAELASQSKSRFLAMMSHELRNPMNGVLGPLALLGQSDLAPRHMRLVDQAQASGRSLVQMMGGLLDYGELQDGRLRLRVEPFRLAALAAGLREDLDRVGAEVRVTLRPGGAEVALGDVERLRHVFVHLADYVLDGGGPGALDLELRHDGEELVGEIRFDGDDAAFDWKLDLMMGLTEIAPQQVSTEALRPLIARGLIATAQGVLSLVDGQDGRRAIRVAVPAPQPPVERVRVRLETRSAALSAIYQAALRSDRIAFVRPDDTKPVDMVLVDATSIGEEPRMAALRARFPSALFVSLGAPPQPETFDDVVESPADMGRLRSRILGGSVA